MRGPQNTSDWARPLTTTSSNDARRPRRFWIPHGHKGDHEPPLHRSQQTTIRKLSVRRTVEGFSILSEAIRTPRTWETMTVWLTVGKTESSGLQVDRRSHTVFPAPVFPGNEDRRMVDANTPFDLGRRGRDMKEGVERCLGVAVVVSCSWPKLTMGRGWRRAMCYEQS